MTGRSTLRIGLRVITALLIAGCAREAGPVRTVRYLRAHPQVLRTVWRRCENDPGDRARTPQCVNAHRAEVLNGIGSFRGLPPLAFPQAPDGKAGAKPVGVPGGSGR